ncbi:hypothetical protein Bbelb_035580 [Branchiostoma belcheri]|nr:hypothetical protein Bbelb_035580 [Branchiostoma belcheri]
MAYLMPGLRGGKVLIHEGYRYRRNKPFKNKMYWKCWRSTCNAPLQTLLFDMEAPNPVIQVSPHLNHGPKDESVEARRVTCRMLAAVEADPSQPARRVYDEVVQEEEDMANMPNFRTVRTQLERRRTAFAPPIPHDVDDVVIPGQWAETWDGHQFLSHQDNDWGFIVFATDRNYRKMGRCRVLYMDGTFKSCPEPYYQVLTIHGLYHGCVIPFVMALLVDKTVGAYRALLDHVQRKVRQESGHRLRPDQIVSDFEVGLMAAYQTEFPGADTSGCYYHFTQNLWKHIQQLGLARPYRQDEHLKKFLRKTMSIGYLPVPLVRMNFDQMLQDISARRLMVRYPARHA